MADISHIKGPDNTSYDIKDATARNDISNLATVASTGEYSDLLHPPTVAEIDDNSTANNKAWSASNINSKLNDPVTFRTNDIPEGEANLGNTAVAHRITAYRNGLSIPYQMDNTNDGGILRVRGTSESKCIFELGTWDDSGAGETIQFNYYPTNSQITPTYSVSVPKKIGTIALTSDIPDISGKVNKSGDTMTGRLTVKGDAGGSWVSSKDVNQSAIKVDGTATNGQRYDTIISNKCNNGNTITMGRITNQLCFGYVESGQTANSLKKFMNFEPANGNGKVTFGTDGAAKSYIDLNDGYYSGKAANSDKWNGITMEMGTNNTTDTWVPVQNGSKWQHRAIPRTIDGTSSVSFTRSHASVSYQEGLVCNRFGNVVTFAGYFSCGATIGANTALYSGLPKPAGGKHIYFTWSGLDFYLHGSDGTIRTNGQITAKTYVGTFTYVCA